jgi:hypothetical protein
MLAIVCAGVASSQSSSDPSGHWTGTIETPEKPLDIEVDLAPGPAAAWGGTITIPAQHVKAFPLSGVTVQDTAVSFAMKGIPGTPSFKGTYSTEARSISGVFSQGGVTFPFSLAWKGEATIEAAPKSPEIGKDLEGSWEGALDAGGATLRLVVTLSNQDGGATGTLVSVDQGGAQVPITAIAQTASHVKFAVSAIGGACEGELKEGQLSGTWTQGERSFSLVLKRMEK